MTSDWLHISIEIPAEEGHMLLRDLEDKHDFVEVDWCDKQRPDFARVSYGPCPPRTESGFTIPPTFQERRQDQQDAADGTMPVRLVEVSEEELA